MYEKESKKIHKMLKKQNYIADSAIVMSMYLAKKLQFDVTAVAMGFILGPVLDYSFGQSIQLSDGNLINYMLYERPISAVILAITPVITFLMWRRSMRLRAQFKDPGELILIRKTHDSSAGNILPIALGLEITARHRK